MRWHCRLHPPKSQSPQEAQVKMMVIDFTAGHLDDGVFVRVGENKDDGEGDDCSSWWW